MAWVLLIIHSQVVQNLNKILSKVPTPFRIIINRLCLGIWGHEKLKVMVFTNEELSAILRLAHAMANADGKITKEETGMIVLELHRFGVDQAKAKLLAEIGDKMSYAEACQIVSRMTVEEKRYVTAYLGTLICADGDIDDSELKLWSLITALCDLPEMNIAEAIQIMANL